MFGTKSASRTFLRKSVARGAAAMLLASSGVMAMSGLAAGAPAPNGNNGTVKLGSAGVAFTNANDPHLSCPIQIQWSGFDPGLQTFGVQIATTAPTGGTVTAVQTPPGNTFTVQPWTEQYDLSFAGGANPNNKGEYHVSITVNTTSSTGTTDVKNKTVWVGNCAAAPSGGTVAMQGACTSLVAGSGYTWTVTATPATAGGGSDVTGTWANHVNAGSPNGTWSTTNGTGTFTTPSGTNQIDVALDAAFSGAGWTISQPAAAPQTCGNAPSGGTVSVTGACTSNTAGSGYTWSVSEAPKAGASTAVVNGTWQQTGGAGSGSFSTNAAGTGSFTTASGVNAISVGLDNASTLAGWTIAGQPGAAPASCGTPANPTPASATATSTCTAASVHLVAGSNATTFTITEPGGSHTVTVPAGQTQDVSYTPGSNVTISVSANGTVLATSTAPDCSTPGQAAPEASASNACTTGITVVLSNLNGTAPVTFTTVAPDGTSSSVVVNAGQLKKLDFAVQEDTTGVVTVTAPGLGAQTFTYKKNCTKVLGEKHVIKTPHKPVVVVKGEKSQLPFTGFNARRTLFDAAALMFFGGILCALAAVRREGSQA